MTEPSLAVEWLLSGAYILLGLAAGIDWLRHRDRGRRFLTLSVVLLGLVALISRITAGSDGSGGVLTDLTLVAFVASGWAFLRFRDDILPLGRRARSAADAGTVAAVVFLIVAFARPGGGPQVGPLQTAAALVLLAVWAGCVGEPVARFWWMSRRLPGVQRSRLRALVEAYAGVVLVLVLTVAVALAKLGGVADDVTIGVSLLTVPLFYVAFAPPRWLRRFWREKEEEPLRQALDGLLLYSPDRQTLADRAVAWAARLVGADGALVATDDGEVLATYNLDRADALEIVHGLAATPGSQPPSGVVSVTLRSEYAGGTLAVRTGPLTPLFGAEEVQRLRGYAASLTTALDRVLLVERLRRSAELIDLAYNPIFTTSFQSGVITNWNKAAEHTYGYTAAEAVGQRPEELLRTELPQPRESIMDELRARRRWSGEVVQVTKSGRVLHVNARWALQNDVHGEPHTVLEINRDVTHEKRMTQALRQARDEAERASTAKSEYLSRMSHELRTPLTAILGYSDLLEMRSPRSDQAEAIASIQEASEHLLSMVNDVLDIARIEAGRETLASDVLVLDPVLEESLRIITPAANQRHVVLQRSSDCPHVLVSADRHRLVQALLNLLSNAVKYSGSGATVTLTVKRRDQGRVRIAVRDTGPGLSEEQLARVFQPFDRLGAERSTTPGTGLGLALTKKLIEAMDGAVGVASSPGRGAEFWVELPEAAGEPTAAPKPPRAPAAGRGGGSAPERTVLYVEDNLATVGLMEDVFALRPEIRVITAMQGSMALELAREHRPDLVVLDMHLPDMTGDEVLRALRDTPETTDIPVVMFSADATERQVQRMLAEGARRYLLKPAKVSEFLEALDEVLAKPSSSAAPVAS